MDNHELQQILTDHADALNQGIDTAEQILKRYRHQNPDQYGELKGLLKIANELKLLLVPLYGREQFVAQLENQLLFQPLQAEHAIHQTQPMTVSNRRPWLWWSVAATGSVVAGVAGFIFWRRSRLGAQVMSTI